MIFQIDFIKDYEGILDFILCLFTGCNKVYIADFVSVHLFKLNGQPVVITDCMVETTYLFLLSCVVTKNSVGSNFHSTYRYVIALSVLSRCAVSMSYYGLSLNSGNLPGNVYMNMTFSASAELGGYFLCFLCFKFGRKAMHVGGMTVGGLGCVSSLAILYLLKGGE